MPSGGTLEPNFFAECCLAYRRACGFQCLMGVLSRRQSLSSCVALGARTQQAHWRLLSSRTSALMSSPAAVWNSALQVEG